jgi:hypothetical protein
MSTGEIIGYTIGLVVVGGVTAGLWLNLIMWIPMLVVGWTIPDEAEAFFIVSIFTMLVAALTVFVVGFVAVGLPWYAAGIAGLAIGLTSYARPTPA